MAIINDIKVFFYSGIQTLPLTMGGTLLSDLAYALVDPRIRHS